MDTTRKVELHNTIWETAINETNNFFNNDYCIIDKIVLKFSLSKIKTVGVRMVNCEEAMKNIDGFLDTASDDDVAWIENHLINARFSETIEKLSPQFISIYRQAETAYKQDLTLICGNGFRKALEQLVYDYAVYKTGGDEEDVKKVKTLDGRIKKYLGDLPNIKTIATAAKKLGNNYTHIIQTNDDDYTLENLIVLVKRVADDISEVIQPTNNTDNVLNTANRIVNK